MSENENATTKPGRPKIHADRRKAQAEASKAYRRRQNDKNHREQAEAAQKLASLPQSSVIDLSAIPPWSRR